MKPSPKRPIVLVANNPLGHHLLASQLLNHYRSLDLDTETVLLCNGVMPHVNSADFDWLEVISFESSKGSVMTYANLVVWLIRVRLLRPRAVYHLRGFVAAAFFYVSRLGMVRHARYIYDPRGAYVVEWREAGRRRGVGRLLQRVEKSLVRHANSTIVTSERFRQLYEQQFGLGPTFVTIYNATCFAFSDSVVPPASVGPVRIAYLGTFNHWHSMDELARVMAQAAHQLGPARVELYVYTLPRFHDLVREKLRTVECASLTVDYVRYEDIPAALVDKHIGISIVRPTRSSRIASPIKVADYVALGLVPLMNEGIGDFDSHFRSNESGILYEFGNSVNLTRLTDIDTSANRQVYDVVSQAEALRRLTPVLERLRHG